MNNDNKLLVVYEGKPSDKRLPKEMRVYEILEKLDIPFLRVDHPEANTIEDCRLAEESLNVKICKNLLLCDRQQNNFYLLLMPGEKHFSTKDFSKKIGSSRLSFAPSEFMEKFLDITPGSLSPLGLANDIESNVTLYIDSELTSWEYIGCHPCINTSSLKIKYSDIMEKFLPYTKHSANIVELEEN